MSKFNKPRPAKAKANKKFCSSNCKGPTEKCIEPKLTSDHCRKSCIKSWLEKAAQKRKCPIVGTSTATPTKSSVSTSSNRSKSSYKKLAESANGKECRKIKTKINESPIAEDPSYSSSKSSSLKNLVRPRSSSKAATKLSQEELTENKENEESAEVENVVENKPRPVQVTMNKM